MIQNILPLLPRLSGAAGMVVTVCSAIVGCGLWLVGARFSRPLLGLIAATGGGAVGFQLPRGLAWSMDPWCVAVLGALILGIGGFIIHRWLAWAGLGLVMATWAALATVACVGWQDPPPDDGVFSADFIRTCLSASEPGDAAPDTSRQLIILTAIIAMLGGFTLAMIWQRLGLVLFWSMTGLTVCLIPALSAAHAAGGHYLHLAPGYPTTQAMALIGLVVAGSAVQWKLTFPRRPAAAEETAKPQETVQA